MKLQNPSFFILIAPFLTLFAFISCDGGGSSDGNNANTTSRDENPVQEIVSPTSTPEDAVTIVPESENPTDTLPSRVISAEEQLAIFQDEISVKINQVRQENNLEPLELDPRLLNISDQHNEYLISEYDPEIRILNLDHSNLEIRAQQAFDTLNVHKG